MGCECISMGTGSLYLARRNVGFLSGGVDYEYKYDVEKIKSGVPKRTVCKITKEISANLKAGLLEICLPNLAVALGGLPISSQVAATAVATDDDAANIERTFTPNFDGSGGETIMLGPGWGLAKNFASVNIENVGETTTYAAGTDYTLDAATGIVTRISGGGIASGATVRVSYTYDRVAGRQLKLGAQFSLAEMDLTFVHTKPADGKRIWVWAPKASVTGTIGFKFDPDNPIINNIELEIIDDSANNPTMPFGYVFEEL